MKPPLVYYGGKTRIADRIVELLPDHHHYVEPFAGSLAVLLAKPRSTMETVNDLDEHLVTFWRVLRDRPDEFARVADLTPHARAEHQAAYTLEVPDELEVARRVWVLLTQGRGAVMRRTGWRFHRSSRPGVSMPDALEAYRGRIPPAAERLHGVSLECRPALDVITDYGQGSDALIYLDPPYESAARNSQGYRLEMGGDAEHRELAAAARSCNAAVVLSGYNSPLYEELYGDWDSVQIDTWTSNGINASGGTADGARTEVLWSNRKLGADRLF